MSRWTFLTMFVAACCDGLDQALRLLGDFHRLEFFLHFQRGDGGNFGQVRARMFRVFGGRRFGAAFRRQAGGDVFGAFNFLRMTFFKQAVGTALFADHVGAGLDRLAVVSFGERGSSRLWA